MKAVYLSAVLATTLALGGCVVNVKDGNDAYQDWQQVEQQNREHLSRLSLGMAKADALTLMGRADFHEAWSDNGKEVQVFYFRTNRIHGDGTTTKEECTPVVFHNNRLVGWGATALAKG
ncbi:DUF3192 domain-containing protein [Shewanella khirikhana]|uniref:DUF3192 domain-containing protein n=1 Tax=Shewanella khirikhana TaxID=1965282 RepID=UPI0030CFEE7D